MRKMERGLGVKKEEIYRLIKKGWWSSACIPSSIQCAGSLSSALHRPPHISRPCTKQATCKKKHRQTQAEKDAGKQRRRQTKTGTETSKIEQIEKQQKHTYRQSNRLQSYHRKTQHHKRQRERERGRQIHRKRDKETKREREIQAERDYTGVDISSAASIHASG